MVLAERGHVGARSKHTSDGELLAIVSLLIYARTVLINERSLLAARENCCVQMGNVPVLLFTHKSMWLALCCPYLEIHEVRRQATLWQYPINVATIRPI